MRDAVGHQPTTCQGQSTKRCTWLPLHDEAKIMVEKYIAEITFLHHVVYIPSLLAIVDKLYCDLKESVKPQIWPP